ncbi:MtN3-like [Oryza sativa Japonica Group]|uniref:MtN3-like n=1 Tax=Oryza sativa subsp. japonica TaxID=39947 RepID=Q5ZD39_ORYSJ|nr:MtN3-like [Oryza sativa Japonica Group]
MWPSFFLPPLSLLSLSLPFFPFCRHAGWQQERAAAGGEAGAAAVGGRAARSSGGALRRRGSCARRESKRRRKRTPTLDTAQPGAALGGESERRRQVTTFKRILKAKSTERFDGLPYLFSLLNCLICLWYGLPWVANGRLLVTTVNGTGAVFQLAYICLFIFYADSKKTSVILPILHLILS